MRGVGVLGRMPSVGEGSLVGFGQRDEGPVRAMGGAIAPIPKDEAGAASPGTGVYVRRVHRQGTQTLHQPPSRWDG